MRVSKEVLQLPDFNRGGAYPLLYSFFDWSTSNHIAIVDQLEMMLRAHGEIFSRRDASLLHEVIRLQRDHANLVGVAFDCLIASESHLIQPAIEELLRKIRSESYLPHSAEFVLVSQFFQLDESKSVPEDTSDMQMALVRNLANPHISEIHLLTERLYDFSSLHNAYKIQQRVIGKRMTFQNAFAYANSHLRGKPFILGKTLKLYVQLICV